MARVKVVTAKKVSKTSKKKPKRKGLEVAIGPKLRLEPRLLPKIQPKKKVKEDSKKATNDQSDFSTVAGLRIPDVIKFEYDNIETASNKKTLSSAQSKNCEALKNKIDSMKIRDTLNSTVETRGRKKKPPNQKKSNRGFKWSDKEFHDFACGLQFYGFGEIEKIAQHIKTKSEKEVSELIRLQSVDVREKVSLSLPIDNYEDVKKKRPPNKFSMVTEEHLAAWPNVRKWRKLAYEQMLHASRAKDYSKSVMVSLLKRFYEEEEEQSDPQVINTKLMYKYVMDCMAGEIPAQLPPKESFIMMDFFNDLKLLPKVYNFKEEQEFIDNYSGVTIYRPIHIKDEFKKNVKEE